MTGIFEHIIKEKTVVENVIANNLSFIVDGTYKYEGTVLEKNLYQTQTDLLQRSLTSISEKLDSSNNFSVKKRARTPVKLFRTYENNTEHIDSTEGDVYWPTKISRELIEPRKSKFADIFSILRTCPEKTRTHKIQDSYLLKHLELFNPILIILCHFNPTF